jgi:hypothetical protein
MPAKKSLKWYTCHWSDGNSCLTLGRPVKVAEAAETKLPFVLCRASSMKTAQLAVDTFNAECGGIMSPGMNPAHIPLGALHNAGFLQGSEVAKLYQK